jgi:diacylglycerol O-acyltransferase / wax synthase
VLFRSADLIHLFATWMGTTPVPLQALLGPLAALLPIPPFNMVCTNVPGPQFPLYVLGHKMLTYYPYVPIGNEMALGCAIQSYDHKLYLGLTADTAAAPDVARLRNFLDQAFASLKKAAGVTSKNFTAPREPVYKGVSAAATRGANGRKAAAYS